MKTNILRMAEEISKRMLFLSFLLSIAMCAIVYLTNEFYLRWGITGNGWMPYFSWIIMINGLFWVFIPIRKLRRVKMSYDITDAKEDIERLELVCLELQKKVFPERFKEKKAEKKEETPAAQ